MCCHRQGTAACTLLPTAGDHVYLGTQRVSLLVSNMLAIKSGTTDCHLTYLLADHESALVVNSNKIVYPVRLRDVDVTLKRQSLMSSH